MKLYLSCQSPCVWTLINADFFLRIMNCLSTVSPLRLRLFPPLNFHFSLHPPTSISPIFPYFPQRNTISPYYTPTLTSWPTQEKALGTRLSADTWHMCESSYCHIRWQDVPDKKLYCTFQVVSVVRTQETLAIFGKNWGMTISPQEDFISPYNPPTFCSFPRRFQFPFHLQVAKSPTVWESPYEWLHCLSTTGFQFTCHVKWNWRNCPKGEPQLIK